MAVMSKQLAAGDSSMVSEMHLTSCALKILATTMGTQDAETARRAMGGHGFSEFAAVGRYYADFLPTTTCAVYFVPVYSLINRNAQV